MAETLNKRSTLVELTHVDVGGKSKMVDIHEKVVTHRTAAAEATVLLRERAFKAVKDNAVAKGDVLSVAKVAGLMAAKKTAELIPLCHPLPIEHLDVECTLNDSSNAVGVTATASTTAKTGIEMEALTAASVAALTIYDMCKGIERGITIENLRLVAKTGGQSDDYLAEE